MPKRTYDTLGVIITRGASPKMEVTDLKFYLGMFPVLTPKQYRKPATYFAEEESVFRAAKRAYTKSAKAVA